MTTRQTDQNLHEARAIVANLARVELRNEGDRRFLESWQGYLARTGNAARIGRYRLQILQKVAASYGLCDPPQAVKAAGLRRWKTQPRSFKRKHKAGTFRSPPFLN